MKTDGPHVVLVLPGRIEQLRSFVAGVFAAAGKASELGHTKVAHWLHHCVHSDQNLNILRGRFVNMVVLWFT